MTTNTALQLAAFVQGQALASQLQDSFVAVPIPHCLVRRSPVPTLVSSNWTEKEWNSFCDIIDNHELTRKARHVSNCSRMVGYLVLFFFLFMFIIFFIDPFTIGAPAFMGIWVALIIVFCCIRVLVWNKSRAAMEVVKTICTETSNNHPTLKFEYVLVKTGIAGSAERSGIRRDRRGRRRNRARYRFTDVINISKKDTTNNLAAATQQQQQQQQQQMYYPNATPFFNPTGAALPLQNNNNNNNNNSVQQLPIAVATPIQYATPTHQTWASASASAAATTTSTTTSTTSSSVPQTSAQYSPQPSAPYAPQPPSAVNPAYHTSTPTPNVPTPPKAPPKAPPKSQSSHPSPSAPVAPTATTKTTTTTNTGGEKEEIPDVEYTNVTRKGISGGILKLSSDRFVYISPTTDHPNNNNSSNNKAATTKSVMTIKFATISHHQISPASHHSCQLKLTSNNNKIMMFTMSSREELTDLDLDLTERLTAFRESRKTNSS